MGHAIQVFSSVIGSSSGVMPQGRESTVFGGESGSNTEVNSQASFEHAGKFTALGYNNRGGSNTHTVTLRVGGANGNNTVAASGTGWNADSTHTDTISAGTLVNFAYTDNGTDPTYSAVKVLFNANGSHTAYHGGATNAGVIWDVGSSTQFGPFCSSLIADGTATESDAALLVRTACTASHFQIRVTGNARANTSTGVFRVNSSTVNQTLSIGAGVTGLLVDTTNTDALAAGDLFNWGITLDSGVQDLTITLAACATVNAGAHKSDLFMSCGGNSRTASATAHYTPIGGAYGSFAETTEANVAIQLGFAATASELRTNLSANTYTGTGTLKLRAGGAAIITLNIGSGVTGWITNTADSGSIGATDDVSYEWDEGTSGSITVRRTAIALLDTGAGNASLSKTLGSLTSSASATIDITGSLSKTLGALTLSASATVGSAAAELSLSKTLGALTSSAQATISITGALSKTLGSLTSSGTTTLGITGSLNKTLGALTVAGTGTVTDPAIEGSLSATLGALTLSASATISVSASATVTLGALTSSGFIFKWDEQVEEDASWSAQSGASPTWTQQSGASSTWTPQTSSGTWTEQNGSSVTWTEQ